MRFWQHAERHQGHSGRQFCFFGQLTNTFRRVNYAAAEVQHRAFGGVNHSCSIANAVLAERWCRHFLRGFRHIFDFKNGGLNILRNVYPHRAWTSGLRNAERIAHDLR
ncbi:hypothetical protein SDC9_193214 [bioreactor metagenome]|uniref:Uncharacterized protein n=1 Tax=bioreactor metagenome TaxID=1076179 RepID=A0A645I2Y4_9ZZZZ